MTPNLDGIFQYYSAVPGQKTEGMFGNLTIGSGLIETTSSATLTINTTVSSNSNNFNITSIYSSTCTSQKQVTTT